MDSTSDGGPSKKQPSPAVPSNGDNNDSPQPPQAATKPTEAAGSAHPPPPYTMGYPPAMGFPQAEHGQNPYTQHYPGYPNGQNPYTQHYPGYPNGYPPGYQYPQAEEAPYYPTRQPHHSSAISGFFRGFILCSCLIVVGIFAASIIMYLVFRPQFPVYKMDSLSVSNFNATNSTFSANWDARVTIENPNSKLKAYFSNFGMQIFWKRDSLAMIQYGSRFDVGKSQNMQMDVKLSSNSSDQIMIGNGATEDMANERRSTGSVNFAVKMYTVTAYRSGSFWTRSIELVAMCEDLRVQFQGDSSNGTWNNGGKSMDCLLV